MWFMLDICDAYGAGVRAAKAFIPLRAVNYAKSQNVQSYMQKSYDGPLTTFRPMNLYRIGVCTCLANAALAQPNHELVMITGLRDRALFFDPNFGFYELVENGGTLTPAAFETFFDTLYHPRLRAGNFDYRAVRSLTAKKPLSFEARR